MSEQRSEAADIEQRYVAEHAETEELLEGLDPNSTDEGAKEKVEGVAADEGTEDHVEEMTRDDP